MIVILESSHDKSNEEETTGPDLDRDNDRGKEVSGEIHVIERKTRSRGKSLRKRKRKKRKRIGKKGGREKRTTQAIWID